MPEKPISRLENTPHGRKCGKKPSGLCKVGGEKVLTIKQPAEKKNGAFRTDSVNFGNN